MPAVGFVRFIGIEAPDDAEFTWARTEESEQAVFSEVAYVGRVLVLHWRMKLYRWMFIERNPGRRFASTLRVATGVRASLLLPITSAQMQRYVRTALRLRQA